MNLVLLIGNIGQDAELKYTQGGTPVMNLRLAVTEKWRDKDGESKEKTEWIDVVMWGKRAEGICPHLKRGEKIHVMGTYQTREWEDKNGNKRRSTEVNVGMKGDIKFLGGGKQGRDHGNRQGRDTQQEGGGYNHNQQQGGQGGFGDDDIPF